MGENKVFSFDSKKTSRTLIDPQLIDGFFESARFYSPSPDQVIQKIKFFNMMMYSKVFKEYSLYILVDEPMYEEELQNYFEGLTDKIDGIIITFTQSNGSVLDEETFQTELEKILIPMTVDPIIEIAKTLGDVIEQESTPKIVLSGLTQAGKTSIKYKFFENWSEALAKKTKPTLGADLSHHFQEFLLHKIIVTDLGGQSVYRNLYLVQEDLWKGIDALIFIVDIQNPESYIVAKNYLIDMWRLISKVNERKPTLSIFFHKYDPKKRDTLKINMIKGMNAFKDFNDQANLYFTSVEDSSSNIALIKALYHSLPGVVLFRLLEHNFMNYFQDEILPEFSLLARRMSKGGVIDIFQELKTEIRDNAVRIGVSYGLSFQKQWLAHLMGESISKHEKTLSDLMILNLDKGHLTISIKNWISHGFPKELTNLLLDGLLEGIFKTLHIELQETIERDTYTTWKVNLQRKRR